MALPPVIAIDGPAASGKGTVAAQVAARLAFHCLDSGALYRLVALAAQRAGVAFSAAEALGEIAASLPAIFRNGDVLLAGESVAEAIRSEVISSGASQVAAHVLVRAALLGRQRDFRQPPGLVAEGRDMGTVVFPDAALKVFLTASAAVRAQRRHKQLMEKGLSANIASLLREIQERDERDKARASAPLKPAADAIELDTTTLGIDQAVDRVLAMWRARM